MSSLDFDHDDVSFCHEVELSPLNSITMTDEVNSTLDDILLEVYGDSEILD